MSVESNFVIHCKKEKQIEAAKNFPNHLTGLGQDYPVSKEMDVDGLDIEFYNCLCIDDFETLMPELCKYIAENVPDTEFSAEGEFCEMTDDYTIIHSIEFANSELVITTHSGYPEYDDEDEDYDDEDESDDEGDEDCDDEDESDDEDDAENHNYDGLEEFTTIYHFSEGKLVEK